LDYSYSTLKCLKYDYTVLYFSIGMETESKGLTLELAMNIVGAFPILMGLV
jgi:hypothetical protein